MASEGTLVGLVGLHSRGGDRLVAINAYGTIGTSVCFGGVERKVAGKSSFDGISGTSSGLEEPEGIGFAGGGDGVRVTVA